MLNPTSWIISIIGAPRIRKIPSKSTILDRVIAPRMGTTSSNNDSTKPSILLRRPLGRAKLFAILRDKISGQITFVNSVDNRFNFAYTGSLIVPALAGASPTNYVMSSMNDRMSIEKTIPVMEAIKVSIYYYDTSDSSFKLYPFTSSGASTEEFVLKLSVQGTKDKRFATKQQDEDDKRLEPNIAPPIQNRPDNTFAGKLINYYKSKTKNKINPEENEEPVGALLPRREFMGIPSKYMQIFIPMAVVLLVLAILLAK